MDAKSLLFVGLGLVLVFYAVTILRGGVVVPTVLQAAIGVRYRMSCESAAAW